MSEEEFADQLGAHVTYLSYEGGNREMPSSLIVKLLEDWKIDPTWLLTGFRRGTIAESAAVATAAYQAILEAAQRAGYHLVARIFRLGISAALPAVLRDESIEPSHADVLVKLATINSRK
jgi:hypothetical protein